MKCPVDLSAEQTYFDGLPHDELTRLRNTTPIFWHERDNGSGYWAVLKNADIRSVSRDPITYSSAIGGMLYDYNESLAGTMLATDPPEHRGLRQTLEKPFGIPALRKFEAFLRIKAQEIIARAATRPHCDFVYDLAAELPLAAISEIMRVPPSQRQSLLRLGDDVIDAPTHEANVEALVELGRFGMSLAVERAGRTKPDGQADDLVATLLNSGEGGCPISAESFGAQFAQLAVAANETTRTLLSNTCLIFAERSDIMDELAADTRLLPVAIEEFLRWVTPIYYFRRTATVDTELRGQTIKRGDAVVMYYLSGNRDEEVFTDPFQIDIRRKPNAHLSFGLGEHVCLGQFLARMETRIFLEEFLTTFKSVKIVGTPERILSNVTNSWRKIPVQLGT